MWLVGVVIRRYIDILIIIINFPYSTCIRSFFGNLLLCSFLNVFSVFSTLGTYGIGYTLNKLLMGFLFYGDKVTVISVYCFIKLVYIVMLFAIGIIW